MNLFTIHTKASYDELAPAILMVASKTGHATAMAQQPEGAVVTMRPRAVWGPARWSAVVLTLASSPFFFDEIASPKLTALQGFGIGWIAAAVVLLVGRT